ncbi:MAG: bacillithiol biosynthesis cysteine-adding enzyme BshC [Acidobacteria bacterium]|nr:MAG: bacillithiol biosynthesis cysteine-adding enzyme BshC [Acidobacteriota bacterium]
MASSGFRRHATLGCVTRAGSVRYLLMESQCIPYTRVPKSSALLLDYLYHFDRVAQFYNGWPFDAEGYRRLAENVKGLTKNRAELAEILERQNKAFGCAEPTLANIRRLSDPATFAVVTGQQVGLLSGPAFTLYKGLTAVKLAQWLSEQGLPSVPVFWLATEDHDLEEVAHTAVFDQEYNLVPLADTGEAPSPRSSVGYVKLTGQTTAALDRLEAALSEARSTGEDAEASKVLLQDLRATYRPGATWGHAFGGFMARLFSRWGVVLLDPLDESIHRLAAPTYERAITRARELRERLHARSQQLIAAGYHAQVRVGDDATLLFLARDGNRTALHQRDGEFLLDGADRISSTDLAARIKTRPVDLSSNALLRPIVQDSLLPTVAYVAGPSELAYLAQSHAIYAEFGRPMPVVFPRAAFTMMDRRTEKLLEKYRLSVADVWQGEEHLNRKIAAAGFAEGWSERLDQSEQDLTRLLERLRGDVEKLDPTLLDTLQHAEEKMRYNMDRLRGKITRAALGRSELLARHAQSLLRFLAPRKELQERETSGVYFLGRAGYELLDRLLDQIQVRCVDHQVVRYSDK